MIRSSGGNNNTLILIILIGLLIAFGVYCVWGKGSNKPEEYTKSSKVGHSLGNDSIEIIQPADSAILEEYNDGPSKENTELLEPSDNDFEMDDGSVSYL
jgi:hypothetical protein